MKDMQPAVLSDFTCRRGTVRAVTFKDIQVMSRHQPSSSFRGFDAQYDIADVTLDNLSFNGQAAGSAEQARLSLGPHVQDVVFTPSH